MLRFSKIPKIGSVGKLYDVQCLPAEKRGMYLQSVCLIPRFHNNTSGIILQIFWSNIEERKPDTLYHCLRSLPLVLQFFKQIRKKFTKNYNFFYLPMLSRPRNPPLKMFLPEGSLRFTHLRIEFRRKSVYFLCCLVILTKWSSHFF